MEDLISETCLCACEWIECQKTEEGTRFSEMQEGASLISAEEMYSLL